MIDKYLIDIIERLCDTSDHNLPAGVPSSTTISWAAHREAEEIRNEDFIPQLITFINEQKDKNKRDRTYSTRAYCQKYK